LAALRGAGAGNMDGLHLALFLLATFAGAFVAGLTGFAFGLIAASLWLFILTPAQTAIMIIAFGLVVQVFSVWKLRLPVDARRLAPFILGAALGVPLGVAVLTFSNPAHVRAGIGAFLVAYSLYGLFRPAIGPVTFGGAAADAGVGFLNGILSGVSGLSGVFVTIWAGLRCWPKDQQRAVFQPFIIATFLMTAAWLVGRGAVDTTIAWLFLAGLPVLLLGTFLGMKLYGRLDEATFRKLVLVLLLISGVALMF
jgi:uncharacterized membrane protein YfcA